MLFIKTMFACVMAIIPLIQVEALYIYKVTVFIDIIVNIGDELFRNS